MGRIQLQECEFYSSYQGGSFNIGQPADIHGSWTCFSTFIIVLAETLFDVPLIEPHLSHDHCNRRNKISKADVLLS
jgi:hypothetical protein